MTTCVRILIFLSWDGNPGTGLAIGDLRSEWRFHAVELVLEHFEIVTRLETMYSCVNQVRKIMFSFQGGFTGAVRPTPGDKASTALLTTPKSLGSTERKVFAHANNQDVINWAVTGRKSCGHFRPGSRSHTKLLGRGRSHYTLSEDIAHYMITMIAQVTG